MRDAAEVLGFADCVQDGVAGLAVPGDACVKMALAGVVGREADMA